MPTMKLVSDDPTEDQSEITEHGGCVVDDNKSVLMEVKLLLQVDRQDDFLNKCWPHQPLQLQYRWKKKGSPNLTKNITVAACIVTMHGIQQL